MSNLELAKMIDIFYPIGSIFISIYNEVPDEFSKVSSWRLIYDQKLPGDIVPLYYFKRIK